VRSWTFEPQATGPAFFCSRSNPRSQSTLRLHLSSRQPFFRRWLRLHLRLPATSICLLGRFNLMRLPCLQCVRSSTVCRNHSASAWWPRSVHVHVSTVKEASYQNTGSDRQRQDIQLDEINSSNRLVTAVSKEPSFWATVNTCLLRSKVKYARLRDSKNFLKADAPGLPTRSRQCLAAAPRRFEAPAVTDHSRYRWGPNALMRRLIAAAPLLQHCSLFTSPRNCNQRATSETTALRHHDGHGGRSTKQRSMFNGASARKAGKESGHAIGHWTSYARGNGAVSKGRCNSESLQGRIVPICCWLDLARAWRPQNQAAGRRVHVSRAPAEKHRSAAATWSRLSKG